MGPIKRLGAWLGLVERSETPSGVLPPPRDAGGFITAGAALRLADVYRAVQVYQTAISQLSIDVERSGQPMAELPALVRRPSIDPELHRSAFLAATVASLRLHGNAYWLKEHGSDGSVINLTPLDPNLVRPHRLELGGPIRYAYGERDDYTAREIQHLKLLRQPGQVLGLGPIQAARVELAGAADVRDYGAAWYRKHDIPSGILTTDQPLPADVAAKYKERWAETHDGGVRILGHGLSYDPILLKPADAQWIEAQRLSTTQIARLFGVPASLMLAVVEGNTQTYANVEQSWIEFIRFSLMTDLREIEEALTACLPRGQVVRFNLEVLLRTDTKTRYEAHEIALRAKFMTVDEVREIEGLPKLPAGALAPATDKEITNA